MDAQQIINANLSDLQAYISLLKSDPLKVVQDRTLIAKMELNLQTLKMLLTTIH